MKNTFKKILVLLVAMVMLLSFAACGEKPEAPKNDIAKLYEEGYTLGATCCTEEKWAGLFQNEEGTVYYKAVAAMTSEIYAKYDAIPFDAEDVDAQRKAIIITLPDAVVTDVTELIPTEEELEAYVGKTLGELENEGFENSGYSGWEGVYDFYFDGPAYDCKVSLAEGTIIENMDDYSANDIRQLVIGHVEYTNISSRILDAEFDY